MKNITAAFRNRLQNSGTLAYGLRVTPKNGPVLGYTSFGRSLTFSGVTFKPNNGVNPGANQTGIGLNVGNSEANVIFDDDEITEAQILGGYLDQAEVLWFIYDWQFLPANLDAIANQQCLILLRGKFGKFRGDDLKFTGEIVSIEDDLAQSNPIVTSPRCRNTLGDARCNAVVANFTGIVTSADGPTFGYTANNPSSPIAAEGFCSNGRVEWTSGANNGSSAKISEHNTDDIILSQLPYRAIAVGDTFRAHAGCNKTIDECESKFNNFLNFRGEPFLPGSDALVRNPRA